MQYEVEQKHRVEDAAALEAQLAGREVVLEPPVLQSDQYFAHPARNFAKTDEALRIRTSGGKSFVTYKGPKLDAATKTRRELELPLHPGDAEGTKFAELLSALGFHAVATVRKRRRSFEIYRGDQRVEGALDEVDGVGTFVELEMLACDETVEEAKRVIRELAQELRLGPSERRSYLELLLEQRRGN
jgi:adenylate cyclase class 2